MQRNLITTVVSAALVLHTAAIRAQTVAMSAQIVVPATGLFGPRALGQSLQPRTSYLIGGLQRGPSGNFLGIGRLDGNTMFATPWRPPLVPAAYVYEPAPHWWLPQDLQYRPVATGAVEPTVALPGTVVATPESAPLSAREAVVPTAEVAVPKVRAGGVTPSTPAPVTALSPAAGLPPAPETAPAAHTVYKIPIEAGAEVTGSPAPPVAVEGHALSDRLADIAQNRGMPLRNLRVVLVGPTAVLEGEVANEHDRTLLVNVARVEPGIWRVENRLRLAEFR
jgi:hypothetical protein